MTTKAWRTERSCLIIGCTGKIHTTGYSEAQDAPYQCMSCKQKYWWKKETQELLMERPKWAETLARTQAKKTKYWINNGQGWVEVDKAVWDAMPKPDYKMGKD